mgnify:CR=1 FL=1
MRILIIVLILLSSKVYSEVFNCEMNITSSTFGDQKYSLLVDIGKETELALTTADIETGKFAGNIASTVYNIGKIYLNEGHPYGFGKIDREVFFTKNSDYMKIGLFFPKRQLPSTIDINRMNGNRWEIFIADTDTQFERIQTGVCK